MDDRWLEKQKFGAMLAVGQGSSAKSRLVTVEYAPKGAKKTLVLVGKGVTFDSGGINLKPSGSIETMKMDMSGAATVAGTMMAVARLKPDVKVVGVMPLVENMPSGAAIRPGDIIRSYDGQNHRDRQYRRRRTVDSGRRHGLGHQTVQAGHHD
jgi:leucyl aminopeptidase